jgi:hypothetical protein
MNVQELLTLAESQGVTVKAQGKRLHLEAKKQPPPELLASLKEKKEELLSLLAANEDSLLTGTIVQKSIRPVSFTNDTTGLKIENVPRNNDAAAVTLDRYRHLVTCQNCAHLSANGRCKVKVDYKPIPDAKQDCSRHQLLQETRQPVADAPYTPDELHALMRRQEDQLLNHLVHCPDCRASDRRWCAHGFTIGSAYDALLMVFDDADDRHQTFVDRVIRKRLEGCK